MTTCREPNGFITQVQILISKRESFVISKREFGVRYSVVNKGQYLASSETLKRSSSPTYRAYPLAFKRANLRWSIVSLRRYAVCWCFNQSGPKRQPYGGDFHSVVQRLNPGNNSLCEIPIKETVALPSEQFYLTTELSDVVCTSFIFVTSFGRYPFRRWHTFSSGKFSAHRLRNSFSVPKFLFGTHMIHLQPQSIGCQFDSQITVICYGSVCRPLFVHSSSGACCISHHLQHSWTAARMAFL